LNTPRHWFRGCYLCPMPRREHDDACPFSRAIRHKPQVPGVVTLGDLRNRLRLFPPPVAALAGLSAEIDALE
jgi:hypothetical protein